MRRARGRPESGPGSVSTRVAKGSAGKDRPKLASPDFKVDNFTTFINYFKNADGDVFGGQQYGPLVDLEVPA